MAEVNDMLERYIRATERVPVLRGDSALAVARPGEFVATGKASQARIPYNGGIVEPGDVITLTEPELTRYAVWIKMGALIQKSVHDAYRTYSTRTAYTDGTLTPLGRRFVQAERDVDRAEKLIIAARAQLEEAENNLSRAQAERAQIERELSDALTIAPTGLAS